MLNMFKTRKVATYKATVDMQIEVEVEPDVWVILPIALTEGMV